jgi:hypothetical protein
MQKAAAVLQLDTVEKKYNSQPHAMESDDRHLKSPSTITEETEHSNKKVLEDFSPEIVISSIDSNAAKARTTAHHDRYPFFYYQNTTSSNNNASSASLRRPRYFALNNNLNNNHQINSNYYDNYGTTITIILLLHVIYFYQWNKKYKRHDICTSYKQIVILKQFYTALLAIVSHPPVEEDHNTTNMVITSSSSSSENDDSSSTNTNTSTNQQQLLLNDGVTRVVAVSSSMVPSSAYSSRGNSSTSSIRILLLLLQQLQSIISTVLQVLYNGSFSGLPLLTYATHILWQCRALEELYDEQNGRLLLGIVVAASGDGGGIGINLTIQSLVSGIGTAQQLLFVRTDHSSSSLSSNRDDNHELYTTTTATSCYSYFHVLIVLGLTSLLLELSLVRIMLRQLDTIINFDGYSIISPQRLLSQNRPVCSIASLVTAVLCVYDNYFPYTPIPILPFIRVSNNLSSLLSSSLFGGMVNNLIIVAILSLLSRGVHPISSILCGIWSGTLWSWGITTFLGTWYWGNMMLVVLLFVILLSLMAQPLYLTYMRVFVPCIDYVAWDEDGNIISLSTMERESGGAVPPMHRNEHVVDLEMNSRERVLLR